MERRQTIRRIGKPIMTIREVIKKDIKMNDLDKTVLDRILWCVKTRFVQDPKRF